MKKTLKDTGEVVNFNPLFEEERDTWELCGARHEVMVGVTEAEDGELTPFEDYFIIFFRPQDTSGGGAIMNWLGDKIMKIVETGEAILEDYHETTTTGREIMEQRRKDGDAGDLEYYAYVTLDETVGSLIRWEKPSWAPWAETDYSTYNAESPFYTPYHQKFSVENEQVNCDNWWYEQTGGCYHALQGGFHKIRVVITCTYEGKTLTKYDSEIGGCNAEYEEDSQCINGEVYQRFAINSPGLWKISIRPVSTGSCNMLDYQLDYEYEIAEPEGWEATTLFTMSNEISRELQDAGIPVSITPLKLVAGVSVVGGLFLYKLLSRIKAKRKKEE